MAAVQGIVIKRIYEPAAATDGYRVLVDRLWPRGLAKSAAQLDDWLKDVAPSPELRHWFGHDPARFSAFEQRYRAELDENPAVATLLERAAAGRLTLLYGARDETHNQARVLAAYLTEKQQKKKS